MPTDICAATVGIQAVGKSALPDRAAWINGATVRGKSQSAGANYCIELWRLAALFARRQRD